MCAYYTHVHMYAYACGGHRLKSTIFLNFAAFCLDSLLLNLDFDAANLAILYQRCCLCLPSARIISSYHICLGLRWVLGPKCSSSCLHSKCFYPWSHLPGPKSTFSNVKWYIKPIYTLIKIVFSKKHLKTGEAFVLKTTLSSSPFFTFPETT